MYRIVRTVDLMSLQNDREHLAGARAALATTRASLTDSRRNSELLEDRIEQLHGDAIEQRDHANAEFTGLQAVIRQVTAERDAAREERDQYRAAVAEIRADVQRLTEAAAAAETGESVRGAIAYGVLRDAYADAHARGTMPGRPFDIVGVVLGFTGPTGEQHDQEDEQQPPAGSGGPTVPAPRPHH